MTITNRRRLTSLLFLTPFGACSVSDLGVEGRDPDTGGAAGESSTPQGGESDTGSGAAVGDAGRSSGGNAATGGDPGEPPLGGEGGSGQAGSGAAAGTSGAGTGGTSGTGGIGGAGGTGGTTSKPACQTGAFENVLFCDDFETVGLPAWTHFANVGSDGQSTRITSPVHFGSGALRSIKSAPGSRDPLVADQLGQRTSGKLYVRVWMYVPDTVTINNDVNANASLLVLGEAPPSDGGVSLVTWQSKLSIQIYDPNGNPPLVQTSSFATTFPRNVWFCARMDFPIGPNVSSADFRLRIDGQTLANLDPEKAVDSALSAAYNRVWVGVNYISPQQTNPVTVYYDDIAVDTVDIACQ